MRKPVPARLLFAFSLLGLSPLLAAAADVAAATASAQPCEARDLGFDRADAHWAHVPMSKLKRDTVYTLLKDADRPGVLRASADRAASLYVAALKPALNPPLTLSWDWKTDALVPGADNRQKSREDAPLRVMVAFGGDPKTLPDVEQRRFKRAKNLAGRDLPYAMLMYIWTDGVPVETLIPSAHTSQIKMLAVASGREGLGAWQHVQRNVGEDYRRAYGAEPGPVIGIAVMTDTDNTGEKAVGDYAAIRISCGG